MAAGSMMKDEFRWIKIKKKDEIRIDKALSNTKTVAIELNSVMLHDANKNTWLEWEDDKNQ